MQMLSSLRATSDIAAKAAQGNLNECLAKLRHYESEIQRLGKDIKTTNTNNNKEVAKVRTELRAHIQAVSKVE